MKEQFLPYEEALALKKLGFDKPCFSDYLYHRDTKKFVLIGLDYWCEQNIEQYDRTGNKRISAPLYQQAFDWFREVHGYFSSPTESDNDVDKTYDWHITKNLGEGKLLIRFVGYHDTYQEARLACIKRLIELCKKN